MALMTREDLVKRQKAAEKAELTEGIPLGLGALGFLGGLVWFDARYDMGNLDNLSNLTYVLVGVSLIGGLGAIVILGLWLEIGMKKRFGTGCPNCNANLTKFAGAVALASGRCGKCGAKVIDD